jgi:hypothetical protein
MPIDSDQSISRHAGHPFSRQKAAGRTKMTSKTDASPEHSSTLGCCGSEVSKNEATPKVAAKPGVVPSSAANCLQYGT